MPPTDSTPAAASKPTAKPTAANAADPAVVVPPVPAFDEGKATAIAVPYAHPTTGQTVAWHQQGYAFTATGSPAAPVAADWQPTAAVPDPKNPLAPVAADRPAVPESTK